MRRLTSAAAARRPIAAGNPAGPDPRERYDANIDNILRAAATVFAEKSFGLASVRDIATRAHISFPRIYYYLRNKEELLYLISKRAFEELIRRAKRSLAGVDDPEKGLRLFVRGHLEYHTDNLAAMKVLVREADTLTGNYAADIARLRREYSKICRRLIDQLGLKHGKAIDPDRSRILTSLLFGAMNWSYTWYDPARDYEQRGRIADEVWSMVVSSVAARR